MTRHWNASSITSRRKGSSPGTYQRRTFRQRTTAAEALLRFGVRHRLVGGRTGSLRGKALVELTSQRGVEGGPRAFHVRIVAHLLIEAIHFGVQIVEQVQRDGLEGH